jgi:hypothetical protein
MGTWETVVLGTREGRDQVLGMETAAEENVKERMVVREVRSRMANIG